MFEDEVLYSPAADGETPEPDEIPEPVLKLVPLPDWLLLSSLLASVAVIFELATSNVPSGLGLSLACCIPPVIASMMPWLVMSPDEVEVEVETSGSDSELKASLKKLPTAEKMLPVDSVLSGSAPKFVNVPPDVTGVIPSLSVTSADLILLCFLAPLGRLVLLRM